MQYIWQRPNWTEFQWDDSEIIGPLANARYLQGRFLGKLTYLEFDHKLQIEADAVVLDAVKTSAIESVILDIESVRSSVASKLGIEYSFPAKTDRHVDGLVEMMLDATHNYDRPLSHTRLFGWHRLLFPSGLYNGKVGEYRDDALGQMEVVSGAYGKMRVHYVAPPADRVLAEMEKFLAWFNGPLSIDPLIFSAIAHMWFINIHPFDDGNGRIGRCILDLALAKTEGSPHRFYSLSSQIESDKKNYYRILEITGIGDGEITNYLSWFIKCYSLAIIHADDQTQHSITKGLFWKKHHHQSTEFTASQTKVINLFLDGKLDQIDLKKWSKITKAPDREFDQLISDYNILVMVSSGKHPKYKLVY